MTFLRRFRRRDVVAREVTMSGAAWEEGLTPAQFGVLRRDDTEAPFSGPTVQPDAGGMYCCAGCGAALFRAGTKFDSGTGWPSFGDAEKKNVELRRDLRMSIPRTDVRCRRCGGHLGHVFRDGPAPTGKRYCINACALAPADDTER